MEMDPETVEYLKQAADVETLPNSLVRRYWKLKRMYDKAGLNLGRAELINLAFIDTEYTRHLPHKFDKELPIFAWDQVQKGEKIVAWVNNKLKRGTFVGRAVDSVTHLRVMLENDDRNFRRIDSKYVRLDGK